jgi:DNA mismatch repair ATPase MutS
MQSGKLDEELARMSAVIDHIRPNALVLFNESFAATNEREGSEIGRQILAALIEKRVKLIFVTHLFDLASSLHAEGKREYFFLRAEREESGKRPFKLQEGEPLRTSFGEDLYRRIFKTAA